MAIKWFSSSSGMFSVLAILALCFNSAASSAILSNETDRLALLAFKAGITDDPLGALSSWNKSIHFCLWSGVTCGRRHQRVTALDLQSHNLAGSISPYIGNLSLLKEVYLQNNSLSSEIPPEVGRLRRLQILSLKNNSLVGEIPANLSCCHKLNYLGLGFNRLGGKIPLELGSLIKLKVLFVSHNSFIGNIPSSFGNMSSLDQLFMAINHLSGTIPSTLGNLKELRILAIGQNGFEGPIPPSIFNLSSMEGFDVGSNQLNGSLPSDLFAYFPRVTFFSLAFNHFIGSIPSSLSNASNLEIFYLTSNNFTGKVPNLEKLHELLDFAVGENSLGFGELEDLNFIPSLTNSTSLQIFRIGTNNLGGILPESISNLSRQLQELAIHENQIVGTIPVGIGNLKSLEILSLSINHLSGSVPKDIGNLRNLKYLYLGGNELTGNIPSSIGNLNYLIDIDFSSNKLQGSIPPSLGNCTNLLVLQFFNNSISGTIPPQLFNISSLAITLDFSDNHFSGGLPYEVGNLKNLAALNVSGNRLSGEIPSSLGSCVSLQQLSMDNNFFQGTIPSSLSSLRGLDYLDLSHNNLSGQIPTFLEDLALLNHLNLSFNNFVGTVPKEGVFKNASATSLEGNKDLCGGIPEFHLQECEIGGIAKNKRLRHSLTIIISIILVFVGVVVIVISILFWIRKKRERTASPTSENSLLQVSYHSLFKATNGFSSSTLIGVGSFGSVYKGTIDGDRVVAVKVFNLQRKGAFKSFIVECETMKNIRHRNLVKVISACSSIDNHANDFKALVYEFMVNGSLEDWLHPTFVSSVSTVVRRKLNLFHRLNVAIDVASALDYLHYQYCQTPIVHCDLKPGNVLLDDEMTGRVSDFGLVKFLSEETNDTQIGQASSVGVRGTVGYAAPEYGMGSEVSTHGDVYSYGILLLEMFTGKRPTDDMFSDSMNLHNYVKRSLPQRVEDITEPVLMERQEDEAYTSGERNLMIIESLVLIFRIGIACSKETPTERMNINDVLAKLIVIRDMLTNNGERGRRAQVPRTHTLEV